MSQQLSMEAWRELIGARPERRERREIQGAASEARGRAFQERVLADLLAAGCWAAQGAPSLQVLGDRAASRWLSCAPSEAREARVVVARKESAHSPDLLGATPWGALALEVKSEATSGPSWSLPPRLRAHQGEALARVSALGQVGAVVLAWGSMGAVALLPWPLCDPRPARLSIPAAALARWCVPRGRVWTEPLLSREGWAAYCERGWR
jgi:hypothetical protein